ncbi:MAG: FHA domain-containing protein, partial [Candidatus Thiodiazotropha sp.]
GAYGTSGFQYRLATTGDYQPSLRFPWLAADERSTNGTRVNGSIVTKRYLKHGDLIEIGKYSLRYIAQIPPQDTDDPDRTVVLKPRTAQTPSTDPATSQTGVAAVSSFRGGGGEWR